MKAGTAAAIIEDTCVLAYDIYLSTHKAASEQVVSGVLKAAWDNLEKLVPVHPIFKEWTRDRAVAPDVTMPYHPTAVQFYKEQKLWSAKMDEAQKKARLEPLVFNHGGISMLATVIAAIFLSLAVLLRTRQRRRHPSPLSSGRTRREQFSTPWREGLPRSPARRGRFRHRSSRILEPAPFSLFSITESLTSAS